jgi:hypothetical protein
MNNQLNNNPRSTNLNFQVHSQQYIPNNVRQLILNNLQQRLMALLQQNLHTQQPQHMMIDPYTMQHNNMINPYLLNSMYQQQLTNSQYTMNNNMTNPYLLGNNMNNPYLLGNNMNNPYLLSNILQQQPLINPIISSMMSPILSNRLNTSNEYDSLFMLPDRRLPNTFTSNTNTSPLNSLLNRLPRLDLIVYDNGRIEPINNQNFENFMEPVPVGSSIRHLRNASTLENYIETYDEPNNQDNCTICQSNFQTGDIVRKLRGCNHYFHVDCVDRWFENSVICPVCRYDIRNYTASQQNSQETETVQTYNANTINNTSTTTEQSIPSNVARTSFLNSLANLNNRDTSNVPTTATTTITNPNSSFNLDLFRQIMDNIRRRTEEINNQQNNHTETPVVPPAPLYASPNSNQLLSLIERYRNNISNNIAGSNNTANSNTTNTYNSNNNYDDINDETY